MNNMKVLFVWPNKDTFGFKHISISLLSAIARRLGCETMLFDTTGVDFGYVSNIDSGQNAAIFKPVDLTKYGIKKLKIDLKTVFLKALQDFCPDCLALSVLSDEFLIAGEISKIAKEAMPSLPIIWGGKYPTLNPVKTLRFHNADFVCVGEGFDAFADFLKVILAADEGQLYTIPNIWAIKDRKIIKNDIRPLKTDIDDLPFLDWDIFDKRHFIRAFDGKVYISGDHMLNWGCPYQCTYCINAFYQVFYKNRYFLRRYSTDRIIAELKYLKDKYNLELFRFLDEDFLMRPVDTLLELSRAYRQDIGVPFILETNPRSVSKEKVLLVKEMGCVSASIAIENGDFNLRKKILKRVDSKEDILRAFLLFKEAGIRTSSFNMLGVPFETRDTYMKTVELNRQAKVQYPGIGFFYPFEGTELRKLSIEQNLFDPRDSEKMVYRSDRPALRFLNLAEEELIQMRNVFTLYVKLPKHYWPFIRRCENLDNVGLALRKELSEIYKNTVWQNDGWYKADGCNSLYIKNLNKILNDK